MALRPFHRKSRSLTNRLALEQLESRLALDWSVSFADGVLSVIASHTSSSSLRIEDGSNGKLALADSVHAFDVSGLNLPGIDISSASDLAIDPALLQSPPPVINEIVIRFGPSEDFLTFEVTAPVPMTVELGDGLDRVTLTDAGDSFTSDEQENLHFENLTLNSVESVDFAGGEDSYIGSDGDDFVGVEHHGLWLHGKKIGVFNLEMLDGRGGNDTLGGRDGVDEFTIRGVDQGYVDDYAFQSLENLHGGADGAKYWFDENGIISGKVEHGYLAGTDQADLFFQHPDDSITLFGHVSHARGILGLEGRGGADRFQIQPTQTTLRYLDGGFEPSGSSSGPVLDLIDFSQFTSGIKLDLDTWDLEQQGSFPKLTNVISNMEGVVGTAFGDYFLSQSSAGRGYYIEGAGGADIYAVANQVPDVINNEQSDIVLAIDDALDVLKTSEVLTALPAGVSGNDPPRTDLFRAFASSSPEVVLGSRAFVEYLYHALVGRPGRDDEVAHWTYYLAQGDIFTEQVVRHFLTQDVDPNLGVSDFDRYFFEGFAIQGPSTVFPAVEGGDLESLLAQGLSFEQIARPSVSLSHRELAAEWVDEIFYRVSARLQSANLDAYGADSLFIVPPSPEEREAAIALASSLLDSGKSWVEALTSIIHSDSFLRLAISHAASSGLVQYTDLLLPFRISAQDFSEYGSRSFASRLVDRIDLLEQANVVGDFQTGSFGAANDRPAIGNWVGGSNDEIGVYRDGRWHLDTNGVSGWQGNDTTLEFGVAEDYPVVGDWDGDGLDNIGTFRRGTWYLDTNGTPGWQGDDTTIVYGVAIDRPVVGDWNGDGIDDLGVLRGDTWHIDTNGVRGWQGDDSSWSLGREGDFPLAGDWNADGIDEPAVFRSETGAIHLWHRTEAITGWNEIILEVTLPSSALPIDRFSVIQTSLEGFVLPIGGGGAVGGISASIPSNNGITLPTGSGDFWINFDTVQFPPSGPDDWGASRSTATPDGDEGLAAEFNDDSVAELIDLALAS